MARRTQEINMQLLCYFFSFYFSLALFSAVQTVQPKRGRALIWPSVKDENPSVKDPRTDHQALPVKKGVKYGANAWIHLRDFKTPHSKNCI
jgi:2OG-Fe(II) oxygenase superfamily